MYKKIITVGVIGFMIILIGGWIMGSYNGMVAGETKVDTAWSSVETQYQRRFDLIPNLVNATKGFLRQEQEVFGAIAEARTRYAGAPSGSNEQVQAANQVESALARLLVIVENYPQLQSNQTVRALMDELAGTENRITVARDRYNAEVGSWNVYIKRFPKNLLASMFGFESRAFFKSEGAAATAPTVNLE